MMKGYCILQEQEPEDEPFLNIQTQISEVTNRIDSYVESILKLTGIDGAVVLDRQLAVVAFGAIIDAKELPATVNVQTGQLHNMADFRHVDLKRFGTRHGSAARFAYHTGGMAIVTSHDGGVKMIRRKDEALVILNDASFDLDLEL
ncbi:MAG: diadenylate cyclase [Verrucomicrobia bacterium]|nr:diadenylate cyclase [Verrucomicrobiota bacterium]